MRAGFGLGMMLLLAVAGGCRTPQGPAFDPRAPGAGVLTNMVEMTESEVQLDLLRPSADPFRLGPGDELAIEIFGDPESRARVKVGPDGKIYYYLLPGLDVLGLTLEQTRQYLERELAEYISDPQVGVTLRAVESRHIWLLGRFSNPGIYPYAAPVTLLEAISVAGGPLSSSDSGTTEELADLHQGFVIRKGTRLPVDFHELLVNGNMAHNIYLQPDDFVYLPSSLLREVYVLGAVRTPRAVRLPEQMTLTAAIAEAGGTMENAYKTHVAIVRGALTEPKIAVIDFNEVVRGKAPDVLLEPRDIVYVPLSPYRTLWKYVDLILTTFVRAVAINEGARAVSEDAGTVAVGITVSP